jgi:Holliday junction resolvase RusA-like endonuclease
VIAFTAAERATSLPQGLRPVLDLLAALRSGREGDDSLLVAFAHEGEPVSKARARWARGRTYTPAKTVAGEVSLAKHFMVAMQGQTLTGNVAIATVFYRSSYQRIDADNLTKLVMDAGTRAHVWKDDSQVTAQASVIELDAGQPRTLVALAPTDSSMVRGPRISTISCARCGAEFEATQEQYRKLYCSQACARPRARANCARCGTEFSRSEAAQRYCSKKCVQADPLVRQKIAASRPAPACITCGGRVSRREYRQCSNCAPRGRRIGSKNVPKVQP